MNQHSCSTWMSVCVAIVSSAVLMMAASGTARAQASDSDDDARLRPAEPDFSVINLPTTLPLPEHHGVFHLTHRFSGNLMQGTFGDQASNLFGLDQGAVVGLEYTFGVIRHLQATVYRTSFDKTFQFSAKYDAIQQSDTRPLGISGIVSIEGANNFKRDYAPSLGLVVSRSIADRLALYATPIWSHNTAALLGTTRDTFFVGVGARLRILNAVYAVGEVSPRVSGYKPDDPEYGYGLEARVGGHVFMLTFTNLQGSTYAQIARGGTPSSLYLGFNLTRKFF